MNAVHPGEKQFFCQLTPVRPAMMSSGPMAQEAAAMAAHLDYMKGLCQRGVVVVAGRTTSEDGADFGMVILRAESGEEAARLANADPAVEQGVLRPSFRPFRIVVLGSQPAA